MLSKYWPYGIRFHNKDKDVAVLLSFKHKNIKYYQTLSELTGNPEVFRLEELQWTEASERLMRELYD